MISDKFCLRGVVFLLLVAFIICVTLISEVKNGYGRQMITSKDFLRDTESDKDAHNGRISEQEVQKQNKERRNPKRTAFDNGNTGLSTQTVLIGRKLEPKLQSQVISKTDLDDVDSKQTEGQLSKPVLKKLEVYSGAKLKQNSTAKLGNFTKQEGVLHQEDSAFTSIKLLDNCSDLDRSLGYCQKRRYEAGHPFTSIASFPGSGNTWTRFLIEQITAIYTSSPYCDSQLSPKFLGECSGRSEEGRNLTLGYKTHRLKEHELRVDQAVVLIRNPLKSIEAELNRQKVMLNKTDFVRTRRARQLSQILDDWNSFYQSWFNFRKPIVVLFYDQLVSNLRQQLKRICVFFKVSCSEELLDCIIVHRQGVDIRPPHNDSDIFSREHHQLAKLYTVKSLQTLKKRLPLENLVDLDHLVL